MKGEIKSDWVDVGLEKITEESESHAHFLREQLGTTNINFLSIGQVCIILVGFIRLILSSCCYLNVAFVTFDTNLSTLNKSMHTRLCPNAEILMTNKQTNGRTNKQTNPVVVVVVVSSK